MTNSADKLLILVDGSSYLHRAFHALPPLTNSQGEPTGAIYGVINMLRKLIADYKPSYIAVVFDAKGKTFRNDLYPEYKANRPPMQDELRVQVQPLLDIIKAMGLPLLIVDGVEADDVIGTLAKRALQHNLKVVISTGDKDIAQLVNDKITLINTMTNSVLDIAGVKEKFGVDPEQIIDYLTLMGDSVDNVPGVPKVGPKTAVKWLQQYGSLAEVIKHADEVKGVVGDNLRASLHQLPLSKQLLTIKEDVELAHQPEDLIPQQPDRKTLVELFKHLEFRSWLSEVLEQSDYQKNYQTIFSEQQWQEWIEKLKTSKEFSFDTETTSLHCLDAEIVGVSLAINKDEAAYIPLAHDYEGAPQQLNRAVILQQLKLLLENPQATVIGQNLKYDMNVLANYGISIKAKMFDTMLESYVLNSGGGRHNMDALALKYLGRKTISYEEVAGKGAKQITFDKVSIDEASEYAAEDADITLQLHHALWPKISEEKKLAWVFTNIEMPLMPVLAKMENEGVLIDADMLTQQSEELAKRLDILEQETYHLAGEVFNLGSPKQLQTILYEKLNLPVLSKTPTGAPSTAEDVLHELSLDYPLPKLILEYRSLSKLKSTYTDSLPKQIHPKTGRVHTSYNQAVTATGRLSSTEPNLQNIPIRTEEGRKIRKAFIAPKGYRLIAADYSQIELRIMAHLTQDAGLLNAFAQDLDIHRATASEVFGVPLDAVTSSQRRSAKAINFGIIYGMSSFGLAKQLGIERNLAQEYIDLYFTRYPGIKKYMDETRELAHRQGYVETIFGRRLYLPDINTSNLQRQRAAERAAINAPMQGTAADIIKLAMINIDKWLAQEKVDAKMIMQVHDELVFEVAETIVDSVVIKIRAVMETAGALSTRLIVGIGVGDNWDDAHD